MRCFYLAHTQSLIKKKLLFITDLPAEGVADPGSREVWKMRSVIEMMPPLKLTTISTLYVCINIYICMYAIKIHVYACKHLDITKACDGIHICMYISDPLQNVDSASEILIYENIRLVCLLDLNADFGVEINADLTPISQLRGKGNGLYNFSGFSIH